MTTPKLTPLDEAGIKSLIRDWKQVHLVNAVEPIDELELRISTGVLRLILAWIHERAMREKAEFKFEHQVTLIQRTTVSIYCCLVCGPIVPNKPDGDVRHAVNYDWLAAVKAQIGWKDE